MIHCEKLVFQYPGESFALRLDSLEVKSAESLAIVGPSGCGKTTLLRLIAGILVPRSGRIQVGDEEVTQLSLPARQQFRISKIGLVFQEFELLDYLTVRDNVLLPFRISDALAFSNDDRERANHLLEKVGIHQHADRVPRELSQGERQRVALCRSLVTQPGLILADEPTGSLDPENQARSVALMRERAADASATLVMVTHDHDILDGFDRVIELPDLLSQ